MSGAPCLSVYTPRTVCPPEQRTFNSDGSRVSEVGLKEWKDAGAENVVGGREKGSKEEESHQRGKHIEISGEGNDEASVPSGLSGETLKSEGSGRKTSLLKKLMGKKAES